MTVPATNDNESKHAMSANEIVLQKLDKGLLTITMNRPDRRNALNADMTRGLVEAARGAGGGHEVRGARRRITRSAPCCSRAPAVHSASAAMSRRWRKGARRCRSKPRWPIFAAAW